MVCVEMSSLVSVFYLRLISSVVFLMLELLELNRIPHLHLLHGKHLHLELYVASVHDVTALRANKKWQKLLEVTTKLSCCGNQSLHLYLNSTESCSMVSLL